MVPEEGRVARTYADRDVVVETVEFVQNFMAELPVQVAVTDVRAQQPNSVSQLAVKSVGRGKRAYLGSFDVLPRARDRRSPTWRPYNGWECALDVKVTGCTSSSGVDSLHMRSILAHGHADMTAARRGDGCRAGECHLVAYLLRRPPGRTFLGRVHEGAWGVLLFDAEVFLRWGPTYKRSPIRLMEAGRLVLNCTTDELPETAAAPQGLLPTARPRPRQDRWAQLGSMTVRQGWVMASDFCEVFDIGAGNLESATHRVVQRRRDVGCAIGEHTLPGRGPTRKIVKAADLRVKYPSLS